MKQAEYLVNGIIIEVFNEKYHCPISHITINYEPGRGWPWRVKVFYITRTTDTTRDYDYICETFMWRWNAVRHAKKWARKGKV